MNANLLFDNVFGIELPSGERRSLPLADLGYTYRHSELPEGAVVIGATFRGRPGEPAAIQAEMEVARRKVEMYKAFVAAIEETKKTKKPVKPKYTGYDAFDYNKESEYKASLDEQERRLGDLQARLNSAYGR